MIDTLRKQIDGLVEYVTRGPATERAPLNAKLEVLEFETRLVPATLVPKSLLAAFFDGTYGTETTTMNSYGPNSANQGVVAVAPATGAETLVASEPVAISTQSRLPKDAKPDALAVVGDKVFVAFSKGGNVGYPGNPPFFPATPAADDASTIRVIDPATGLSSSFAVKGRETLALAPSADGKQLLAAWFDGTYGTFDAANPYASVESATEGVSSFNPATGAEVVLFSRPIAAPSGSSRSTPKFDSVAAVGDTVFVAASQPGNPYSFFSGAATDDTSTLLAINVATGVGTPLAAKSRETLALTASADGKLLLAAYFDGTYSAGNPYGADSATQGVIAFDPATGNEAVLFAQAVVVPKSFNDRSVQAAKPVAIAAIDGQVFLAVSQAGNPYQSGLSRGNDDMSTIFAINLSAGTSTPFPAKGRETLALAAVPAPPVVVNTPPTLTPKAGFAARTVPSGTATVTGIAFEVADAETPVAALGVTVTSSNPALLPNEAARFGLTRSGNTAALTLTPAANVSGSTTVTVTVTDAGGLAATNSFVLTVAENNAPTLTPKAGFAARTVPSGTVAVTGITFEVADAETPVAALGVTVTSSNPALLTNEAALFGLTRSGNTAALTLTPLRGAFGATTVTVTVRDAGGLAATSSFVLTVAAPPPAPALVPADVLAMMPALGANPRLTTADLNGDGVADFIGVTNAGGVNLFQVFDGKSRAVIASFSPFETTFTGGLYVAAGDLTGTGRIDIIVSPDVGGGPVIAVYNGKMLAAGVTGDAAQVVRFFGIDDPAFRGGARTAAGFIQGNSALIVSAGFGGGPRIAIFNGASVASGSQTPSRLVGDFFAFENTLRNGAYVAAADINGDGVAEVAFGGGPGGGPRVRVIDGKSLLAIASAAGSLDSLPPTAQLANFFSGEVTSRDGVRVGFRDVFGDGKAELTTQGGAGGSVRVYRPGSLIANPNAPVPDATLDPLNGAFVG